MENQFQLVLGTGNQKKRAELEHLLADYPVQLYSLKDLDSVEEPEETGSTFAQNAAIKAEYYAKQFGHWVLAEDSGLCVKALDGAPGVYSARFSGPQASDQSNNDLLIDKIKDVPMDKRHAWYTCHICIADHSGNIVAESTGQCHGRILDAPRGEGGFGYDPLFELPEYHRTFGEMGACVKKLLSHRGRAYRMLLPKLVAITTSVRNRLNSTTGINS